MTRQYTFADKLISQLDMAVATLLVKPKHHQRQYPAHNILEQDLSDKERKHAAGLMRVNHVGEVCAQALYQGQAITARSEVVKNEMNQAALEELDHLAWCTQRLSELDSHTSYLNWFWYLGALSLGLTAGALGDKWSLGFLAETEAQVVKHLESHFNHLPSQDHKSLSVVRQMRDDEAKHHDMAIDNGAAELPKPIKKLMSLSSKVMTSVAYYL